MEYTKEALSQLPTEALEAHMNDAFVRALSTNNKAYYFEQMIIALLCSRELLDRN